MSTGEWFHEELRTRTYTIATSRVDLGSLVRCLSQVIFDASSPVNRFVLVIPALNEGRTIREVVTQALHYIDHIIVVNDGSADETSQVLADLPITLLTNATTMGKAASLWLGFQRAIKAGAQAIVTIDGDGQHAPEDISHILMAAEEWMGSLILGARKRKDWRSTLSFRVLANWVADFWISWAAGYRIADSQSGFRVYPVSLLRELTIQHGRKQSFVFESEVLIEAARLGVCSVTIDIQARPPQGTRPSHFRPIVDILRITKMVAWRLLSRGMYIQGLFQLFTRSPASPTLKRVSVKRTNSSLNRGPPSRPEVLVYRQNSGSQQKPQRP